MELIMTLDIPGNPITKKNNMQIVRTQDGRPFLIPSKQYKQYEKMAGYYIKGGQEPIDYPVNVKCLYFMETRRRVDLTNLLEATDDILVKYGIIEDDNFKIVKGHDGSRVLYDKGKPRVEIYIEKIDEE